MTEPIPVRVRECPDGTHPDGDVVYIAPKLSLAGGIAASRDIVAAGDNAALLFDLWMITFCRHGAVGWNLHEDGQPLPFDPEILVSDFALGFPVADKADDLYRGALLSPLAPSRPPTSLGGPTDGSMSPQTTSTGTPPRSSSRKRSAGRRSPAPTR